MDTDDNDDFVLPCAIDFQTLVAIGPRTDAAWPNPGPGVVEILLRRGRANGGAHLSMSGNVSQGGGLSSSAALRAPNQQWALAPDPTEIARIAPQVDNDGVRRVAWSTVLTTNARVHARPWPMPWACAHRTTWTCRRAMRWPRAIRPAMAG